MILILFIAVLSDQYNNLINLNYIIASDSLYHCFYFTVLIVKEKYSMELSTIYKYHIQFKSLDVYMMQTQK